MCKSTEADPTLPEERSTETGKGSPAVFHDKRGICRLSGRYFGFPGTRKTCRCHGALQGLHTVAEEEIPDTEVLYTIVGGKVLYQK